MRIRRWILSACILTGAAIGCSTGFSPASRVEGLRVLGVEADVPYPAPGDAVTLRMTVTDGLRDDEGNPRSLQMVWIAGCVNPPGDLYYLCFPQLASSLGAALQNGQPTEGVIGFSTGAPEQDGEPGAHTFTFTIPETIVSDRPLPDSGPHYGIEYVFFAACAGTLAPAPFTQTGGVPDFPLQCLDADGNPQGPESFVPGYTQVYSFADGRTNANPPTNAILLDGEPLPADPAEAPTVPRCPVTDEQRRASGCSSTDALASCKEYAIEADVPDVAEVVPETSAEIGGTSRETIWVSYFSDAGDLEKPIRLVSAARDGYQAEFGSKWIAPSEPGLVSIWAVTRDQRGGQSVRRGWIRVE